MATYTPEELADGFEFKFLRSATGRFRDPEFLRQCLEEEAAAGWTLIEKFDNGRVRLKRPAAARRHDSALGSDPYRTTVGMGEGRVALVIVLIMCAVIGLVAGVAAFLAQR